MAVVTDPVADMLTRIRNANAMRYKDLEVSSSKLKEEIAKILKNEGYIENYEVVDTKQGKNLKITLKYQGKERVITGLKRISKPGLRVYAEVSELPRVLNGLGIAIISTSAGLKTDKEARLANLGGEVMLYVW